MKRFYILIAMSLTIACYSNSIADDAKRSLAVKPKYSQTYGIRIALVIGNGNYRYSDILPKLTNPIHDAEDIASALRGFGFEVIEKINLNKEEMDAAFAEFGRKIGNSDAALFYFAGHGLQVKGQNYLIPVDAMIESEAQIPYKSINVNQLLEEMETAKSLVNIVMLDACRNNPISGKFRSGTTRGLAAPASTPKGTVIIYATEPGNVAADGTGRNGLFTAGLLTAFRGRDLSLHGVLTLASEEVMRKSGQKQIPFVNGPLPLQKNFQFASNKAVQVADIMNAPDDKSQPAPRQKSSEEIEQETWETARLSSNLAAIEEYLKHYPDGKFVAQAKVLIVTLTPKPPKPAEPYPVPRQAPDTSQMSDTDWRKQKKAQNTPSQSQYFPTVSKGAENAGNGNSAALILSPAATVFDLFSLPTRSTDGDKARSAAAYRPATWGKADSMIARASKQLNLTDVAANK